MLFRRCLHYVQYPLSFSNAKAEAARFGNHLAFMKSKEDENAALLQIAGKANTSFLLGIEQKLGKFYWTDGTSVGYNRFNSESCTATNISEISEEHGCIFATFNNSRQWSWDSVPCEFPLPWMMSSPYTKFDPAQHRWVISFG